MTPWEWDVAETRRALTACPHCGALPDGDSPLEAPPEVLWRIAQDHGITDPHVAEEWAARRRHE